MKERPILSSALEVRALLSGTKTQIRRAMRYQPLPPVAKWVLGGLYWLPKGVTEAVERQFISTWPSATRCPYGQPGDRLWVKETHRVGAWREDGRIAFDYAASPEIKNTPWCQCPEDFDFESAWAKWSDYLSAHNVEPDDDGDYHWEPGESPLPWRPSIYMPHWASRITLEVTAVRVERLQDISDEDAKAEGMMDLGYGEWSGGNEAGNSGRLQQWPSPVLAYHHLWESINGPGSWDENPWVWVVEFKRV